MSRRRFLALVGLVLPACGEGDPPAPHPSTLKLHAAEPWARQLVERRPRTWLAAFLRELGNPDEEVQAVAAFAVAAYGADAVRDLVRVLEHGSPRARAAASFCLGSIGAPSRAALEALLATHPPAPVRQPAEAAYYVVATDKAPELAARLGGSAVERARARAVLLGMEGAAVPILASALGGGDDRVRLEAAALLGELGGFDRPAARRALLALVASGSPVQRAWALVALGRLGPGVPEVDTALVAGLADPAVEVRAAACEALGRSSPTPGASLALGANIEHADRTVRAAALLALARLPGDADLSRRVAALGDADPSVRLAAIESLRALGEAARDVRPALRPLVDDTVPWVRQAAKSALASLGD